MEENVKNLVWKLLYDLSNKKGITEVVINNPKAVFVEREGQFIQLNTSLSRTDIEQFIVQVADYNKKKCDANHPTLDGILPDGSRVNIIREPFVMGSPAITIRKYLKKFKSFENNLDIFGLNERWIKFLRAMVQGKMNIIISGGTGVGKTTLMNLLLGEIDSSERIVSIEDTKELTLNLPNVVRMEVGSRNKVSDKSLSLRDLVKNTLRMRPDRIIIGEVRGGELFDLLQAMNTGHDGSMTSIHSNSPVECFIRMETLYLLAGYDVPTYVIRRQVSTAVDFVIQLSRAKGGARVISQIAEITGMEGGNILMQFIAEYEEGILQPTGITPKRIKELHEKGDLPLDFFNQ